MKEKCLEYQHLQGPRAEYESSTCSRPTDSNSASGVKHSGLTSPPGDPERCCCIGVIMQLPIFLLKRSTL